MTIAIIVAGSLVGAACSSGADTVSVDAVEVDGSARIPTTTIGSRRTTTTTTTVLEATPAVAQQQQLDATFASVLAQIAANPQLAATIGALQNADLAAMFKVDGALLAQLGIDAAAIQGLGALLMGAAPAALAQVAAGSNPTPAPAPAPGPTTTVAPPNPDLVALGQLLELVRQINGSAIGSIDGLSPELISSLSRLVDGVNPADLQAISSLLMVIDPNGLGKLSQQSPGAAAVLAVVAASLLANDPMIALGLREGQDPASPLMAVLGHIEQLSAGIPPEVAAGVLQVGMTLRPDQLEALGKLLAVMADPTTRALLAQVSGGQL